MQNITTIKVDLKRLTFKNVSLFNFSKQQKNNTDNILSGIHHRFSCHFEQNTWVTVYKNRVSYISHSSRQNLAYLKILKIDIYKSSNRCQRPRRNPDTVGKCRGVSALYAPLHSYCKAK